MQTTIEIFARELVRITTQSLERVTENCGERLLETDAPENYLDCVDDEAGEEEEEAEREQDEHEGDRHGRRRVSSLVAVSPDYWKSAGLK